MDEHAIMWVVAGLLALIWFVGLLMNLGIWIHALLMTAFALVIIEGVVARRESDKAR